MTMRRLLLAATLLLLGSTSVRAESVFGFSYFGREVLSGDARIEGRGGMGIAYTDSMNASVLHASQLADLERVTIGLTSRYTRANAEDQLGSVKRLALSTPVIRMGLPLPAQGGLGIGFSAARSTQWTVGRQRPEFPVEENIGMWETLEREGTQFAIPIQVGYRFFDHFGVGAGMHFRGGTIRFRYDVGYYNLLSQSYTEYLQREIREDTYSGWQPELSFALNDIGPLSLAGYWMPQYDADVDVGQATLRDPSDDTTDRTDTMPQRFGAGFRLRLPARMSLGADFTLEEWSAYEGRSFTYDEAGNFDPEGTALPMEDEQTLRVGLERESVRRGLRYTLPLRLGFYMRDWHYQVNGSDLSEWGVTLGSGLALRAGLARIDFAIGYSKTGNRDENGIEESLWTVVLSVAGGERWY
jgi:hypothetical protein